MEGAADVYVVPCAANNTRNEMQGGVNAGLCLAQGNKKKYSLAKSAIGRAAVGRGPHEARLQLSETVPYGNCSKPSMAY